MNSIITIIKFAPLQSPFAISVYSVFAFAFAIVEFLVPRAPWFEGRDGMSCLFFCDKISFFQRSMYFFSKSLNFIYGTRLSAKSLNSTLNFINIRQKIMQKNFNDLRQAPNST